MINGQQYQSIENKAWAEQGVEAKIKQLEERIVKLETLLNNIILRSK